jgi:hypothetical protein
MKPPENPVEKGESIARAIDKMMKEQRSFEERRQTRLGRGAERITRPASGLLRRFLPPGAIQRALEAADRGAGMTLPKELKNHDVHDLTTCESAAIRVQAWSAGTNAATGSVAGFFGGVGMTMDIPATITLAARNVRATGLAYGFGKDDEDEALFRLMILELATTNGFEARQDTLGKINGMARQLNEPEVRMVLDKGAEWVVDKVTERVARSLGTDLLSRKAAQVVPIAGGLIAAGINASFQTDVSRAARYAYRQRWLMHRKMIAPPKDAE